MTPDVMGGSISIGSPGSGSDSEELEGGITKELDDTGSPAVAELDSIRLNDELEGATEELDSRCPVSMLLPDSGSINSGGTTSPEVTSSVSIS